MLAIDPGYATQGVCLIGVRTLEVLEFFSSVTTSSLDVYTRVNWQLDQILTVLALYGGNILLVVEEFRAGASSKASPTSIYNRAIYDTLLRLRVASRCRFGITVHNTAVWAWSEPQAKFKEIWDKKKKKHKKKRVFPTGPEVISYITTQIGLKMRKNWERRIYRVRNAEGKLDSLEAEDKSVLHAADSLVMGGMGLVACVRPDLIRGRTVQQQAWISDVREKYDFEEPPEAGCR